MAKADIELTLKSDLSNLKEISGRVSNLKPEAAKRVNEGLEAAEKAFNSKDWSTFRVQVNKVVEILSKAIINTGKVSAELQKALEKQQDIQKRINDFASKRATVASKYQDKGAGKMYAAEATKFYHQTEEYKSGKIVDSKGIKIGKREDAIAAYESLQKAMAEMGKNWQTLNQATVERANKILAESGKADISIKDIGSGRALNRAFKQEGEQEAADKKEIAYLDEQIKSFENDAKEIEAEIKKLTPASEAAAKGLEDVYQELVKISNATNKDITAAKADERYTKAEATGGGAALEPKEIEASTKALDKQSTSLGKAFKQFSIYAIALRTVKKAVNEATRTIKDLDKYLTTQAMVTGKTRKETYELLKTYQDMASQLGATTKEVAEVATQFMRQGKTAADAMKLTEAAISAAKVAGIGVTESVNYLTTALNGFQLSAEDAMRVSDKFASIAAQSATSYDEIATALSKVAAQANMAGMSIDYTTALLAKGIETTREAPETIGTALKTIIARMRELTDYGATLEDGMNINNVEKQLSYVGIALRTETGELRSTEDVLDELGRKWIELSSNQQAAVAKALAGTRQQSRLIAMMTDYERVIELQQIAQRSAGATAAQAATYMEGMEAALNKVNVAWEKIVTTATDSGVIINIINKASELLNGIADFLEDNIALFTTLAVIAAVTLTHFVAKFETQKAINRAALEETKVEREKQILAKRQEIEDLKALKNGKKLTKEAKERLKTKYLTLAASAREVGNEALAVKYDTMAAKIETEELLSKQEELEIESEIELKQAEIAGLKIQQAATDLQILQNGSGIVGVLGKATSLLMPMISILTIINTLTQAYTAHKLKANLADEQGNKIKQKGLLLSIKTMFADVVSSGKSLGLPGIIAAIAVASGLAIALGFGIAAMTGAFNTSGKSIGDSFNETSNDIYKLTEKSNNLKKIISDFEEIDNKVIKTNEDIKEMNKLLETAADKLDEQEKADYNNLVSQQAKIEYLRKRQQAADDKALEKRNGQIAFLEKIGTMPGFKNVLNNLLTGTSSDALAVQSAIIANNNDAIYRYIDNIGGVAEGVEYFTQSIFENMDALDAYRYATEEGRKELEKIVDIINKASKTINGEEVAYAEIINSEDYTLTERLDAYQELLATLQQVGDPALTKSLMETYKQWQMLGESFGDTSLKFMEQYGVTIDELNNLSKALQKLGYDAEESAVKINQLFEQMANGATISDAIWSVFGVTKNSDEFLKILNAYQKAVGKTILDVGQNLQSFKSQINSVYEMVGKWSTLSDSEKTQFLNENADLFKGASGKDLYRAFETGNYDVIEQALKENEYLQKQLELRKQELQVQLDIERAREGTEEYDIATVRYLEEQLALLEDMENIFKADLKLRVEQENAQLDIYKTYLQKQQDALTESLEKRKDAYQKYFDAINQEAEDEDYEEQANTLITNLSKLSSSTNADAMKQSKELEKQLEELEKERLDTLRERAQEAIMQNLEDEVSQINEKFDKLLENNQAVLQMIRQDLTNPDQFVADMLGSNINNMTALGAEQWIEETLKTAFGSKIDSDILDNITVRENGNNLTLNIAGQPIDLGEASQRDLADTILKALRQLGISV